MIQNLKKQRNLPFAFSPLVSEVSRQPQQCINFCSIVKALQEHLFCGKQIFPRDVAWVYISC